MPAKITCHGEVCQVRTPNMVHAKHTTPENAKKQQRLLNAIDHGFVPSKNKIKAKAY